MRSAEEWLPRFLETSEAGSAHGDDCLMWRNHDACTDCIVKFAKAYAREVGETVREEAASYIGQRGCQCGAHFIFYAADIRQIEVKMP